MQKFADQCELSASVEEVAGAIMSAEYLEYRYKTETVAHFELSIQQDDDEGFAYRLRRSIGLGRKVPRIVQNLVGDSLMMVQEGSWRREGDGFVGQFRLSEERFSGGVEIEVRLEAGDPEICILSFQGQLQVNVPLVGKQLEKLMVDRVAENFADSIEAIEGYLEART